MNKAEIINHALVINAGKSTRSEDLQHYRDFFVDPINSSILEQNTKQLIYGRRGSGKTLVMGAINEKLQESVKSNNVMSFSYSAIDFRSSAEYGGLIPTVKEKTHAFFHSFVEQLSHDICNFADDILKKPTLRDYFKLNGPRMAGRRDRFATSVLELLEAVSYGSESPLPTSLKIIEETTELEESKRNASAKADSSASASIEEIGIGIKAYMNSETSSSSGSKAVKKIVYESARKFNPKKVKNLLVDIIDILKLDYIIIFIDEWMSLAECQVEFAERLRQCLFGESKISIKIAADPYQGQFNNSGQGHNFRGIEIGGDIFEAVNLDLPFRDQDRLHELFAEALYKRLRHFEPSLTEIFGKLPSFNSNYFIESIFTNKRAFMELCIGAHGLCRDFHRMFQMCTKRINWDVSQNRIDMNCVRKVIFDKTEETYGRIVKSIDSNKLLFGVIRPHIMQTKSRYFLIESRPDEYTAIIKDLLSKRIIHNIPMSQIHSTLRGEYDCFEIDYGIFLDLARAMEFSTGERMNEEYDGNEVLRITSANKQLYMLKINSAGIEKNDAETLLCQHCDQEFSSIEKAYAARKICPHCFADQ